MADKRPRINPEIYKEFQRLAIENDTTAEVEINKALDWARKQRSDKKNGVKPSRTRKNPT